MYLEIYQLHPLKFLSVPRVTWQVALKKIKVHLELSTDLDVLLMVKKGIRGEICHCIDRYVKGNSKYMKHYDKDKKNCNILIIGM